MKHIFKYQPFFSSLDLKNKIIFITLTILSPTILLHICYSIVMTYIYILYVLIFAAHCLHFDKHYSDGEKSTQKYKSKSNSTKLYIQTKTKKWKIKRIKIYIYIHL